jgi:membrane-associated phospholipid phosphatase
LPLFEIIVSQCLSVAFVRIAKVLIGRARPTIYLKTGIYGFHGFEWDHHYHSFPSGHTLMIFTWATSLSLAFPKWRIPLFILATLLALSRVLLAKHYLSDVLGTAAIGMIIATFVHLIVRKTHWNFLPK